MKYRISSPEKGVIRLLIVAVLWLTMGSLVNFHMNRIFGKELISQTLYCQRQKDKTLSELSSLAGLGYDFVPHPALQSDLQSTYLGSIFTGYIFRPDENHLMAAATAPRHQSLRAPPQV